MSKGDFDDVNWIEFLGVVAMSAVIGITRLLYLIRRGRSFTWIDAVLEPALAVFAGVISWGVTELTDAPDVLQAVITSLGAWGGPRTIHKMELKYLGGSRRSDFASLEESSDDEYKERNQKER